MSGSFVGLWGTLGDNKDNHSKAHQEFCGRVLDMQNGLWLLGALVMLVALISNKPKTQNVNKNILSGILLLLELRHIYIDLLFLQKFWTHK